MIKKIIFLKIIDTINQYLLIIDFFDYGNLKYTNKKKGNIKKNL